jgi:hypothetical protein
MDKYSGLYPLSVASRAFPSEIRMQLSEKDQEHIKTVQDRWNIQKLPDIYRFALANLVGSPLPKKKYP